MRKMQRGKRDAYAPFWAPEKTKGFSISEKPFAIMIANIPLGSDQPRVRLFLEKLLQLKAGLVQLGF